MMRMGATPSRQRLMEYDRPQRGFTLVELLVGMAVFVLLMGLLFSLVSGASRVWEQTENQKSKRQIARIVSETIVRDLESVLFPLNPDDDEGFDFVLNPAIGESLLNPNAIFWQAPVQGGKRQAGLQEVGYFIRWIDASSGAASELCRYQVEATNQSSMFLDSNPTWITDAKINAAAPGALDTISLQGRIAENVIALWITLFDKNGSRILSPYSSRDLSKPKPTSVVIEVAIASPRALQRASSLEIRNKYGSSTVDAFVAALPEDLRKDVEIFRFKARIQSN